MFKALIAIWLLASVGVFAAPEVLTVDEGVALTFRLGGRVEKIPWTRILLQQSECEMPPCKISSVRLYLVDAKQQYIYFVAIQDSPSWNPPASVQRWSFRERKVERIASAFAGIGDPVLSPDGKFAAYIASYKACAGKYRTPVEVIDLTKGGTAELRDWAKGVLEVIDEIKWTSLWTLQFKGTDGTEPEAMNGGYDESKRFPISGTLDLKIVKWLR